MLLLFVIFSLVRSGLLGVYLSRLATTLFGKGNVNVTETINAGV